MGRTVQRGKVQVPRTQSRVELDIFKTWQLKHSIVGRGVRNEIGTASCRIILYVVTNVYFKLSVMIIY